MRISGDEIAFRFRTKNGKLVRRTVENAALARELRELVALENGSRLFRYEREGETVTLTAPVLNDYIAEHLGNGFTAMAGRTIEDFRGRSSRPARLSADERALYRMLRSRR